MVFTPHKVGAAFLALALTAAPLIASAEPGGPPQGGGGWNRGGPGGPGGGSMDNRGGGRGGPGGGGQGFDR